MCEKVRDRQTDRQTEKERKREKKREREREREKERERERVNDRVINNLHSIIDIYFTKYHYLTYEDWMLESQKYLHIFV